MSSWASSRVKGSVLNLGVCGWGAVGVWEEVGQDNKGFRRQHSYR